MPTYVYEIIDDSTTDPRRFEVEQRMSEPALTRDPVTGKPVRRVISGGAGFITGRSEPMVPCASGGCMLPQSQAASTPCGAGHVHGPGCGH